MNSASEGNTEVGKLSSGLWRSRSSIGENNGENGILGKGEPSNILDRRMIESSSHIRAC